MSSTSAPVTAPNASQAFAWQALGPLMVGLMLHIFVSGMCYLSATQVLSSKTSVLSKNIKIVLAITLLLNTLSLASSVANLLLWGTTQTRDEDSLVSSTVPDAYAPLLFGLTAFVVQGFFAERAWKICNRSTIFACYISACMLIAPAGSIGLSVRLLVDLSGDGEDIIILRFTELYTWAAAITDMSISSVIIYGLHSRKTGLDTPTDGMVSKVVAATMESAAFTTSFALAAAVTDAITWQGNSGEIDLAFLFPLPSIYIFSLLWCLHATKRIRKDYDMHRSTHHSSHYQSAVEPAHASTYFSFIPPQQQATSKKTA